MYRTLSKRFEFSASHRCSRTDWSVEENRSFYGSESSGEMGHGHNFDLYTVFSGDVDPRDGMIINVTDIKAEVNKILASRYDHKSLNVDTPVFAQLPPTVENIAFELLSDVQAAFRKARAKPVVCHLAMDAHNAATAYSDGHVERHARFGFDAVVRWHSPHLSGEENRRLFGKASGQSGVGRSFSVSMTLGGDFDRATGTIVPYAMIRDQMAGLRKKLHDCRLNDSVGMSSNAPFTLATLCSHLFDVLRRILPIVRIRIDCRTGDFAEYSGGELISQGMTASFNAAHRLNSSQLTADENLEVYGKCNNPAGHGHRYVTEVTVAGPIEERLGLPASGNSLDVAIKDVLQGWKYKHLDRDLPHFAGRPTTAENIIDVLWKQLEERLGSSVSRLRLWETRNNRFALRRMV